MEESSPPSLRCLSFTTLVKHDPIKVTSIWIGPEDTHLSCAKFDVKLENGMSLFGLELHEGSGYLCMY